jgi:hypothetical protein
MQWLPPHTRRLIDLYYRKERRMKDAAAILGITVATAKSRLLRARRVLLRSLKQNGCSTPESLGRAFRTKAIPARAVEPVRCDEGGDCLV